MSNDLSDSKIPHVLIVTDFGLRGGIKKTAIYDDKIKIEFADIFFGVTFVRNVKDVPLSAIESVEYLNNQVIRINLKANYEMVSSRNQEELSAFIQALQIRIPNLKIDVQKKNEKANLLKSKIFVGLFLIVFFLLLTAYLGNVLSR